MIDLVYVFDILVLFIVLGYRGRQNGMLPESFFCFATLMAGFAAEANYRELSGVFKNMMSGTNFFIIVALSYAVLFIGIRVLLATLGLQMFTEMRTTTFIEPLNKVLGIFFAIIKAIILASVVLRFMDTLNPFIPDITNPIHTNTFVGYFYDLISDFYLFFFS